MLIPSSVMLIELLGRPLIVESRAVPDVLNPGNDVKESMALRLVRGRLMIWVADMVVATDGVWVWTTRPLSPTTVTFSSIAPTDSTTFTLAGTAALSVTVLRVTVLNPINETVTL